MMVIPPSPIKLASLSRVNKIPTVLILEHRMELRSQGVTIEEIEEVEPEDSFTSQGSPCH